MFNTQYPSMEDPEYVFKYKEFMRSFTGFDPIDVPMSEHALECLNYCIQEGREQLAAQGIHTNAIPTLQFGDSYINMVICRVH